MNDDYNLNKFNHGTEFADRTVLLKESFAQIEKDNLDFFSARPHPINENDHDRLDMHYVFIFTPDIGHRFGFNDDSDLPKDIRDLCISALKAHFPS